MLADPRAWLRRALILLALPALWFAALALDSDALFDRFGMNMHAITFLALFVATVAGVAAAIFRASPRCAPSFWRAAARSRAGASTSRRCALWRPSPSPRTRPTNAARCWRCSASWR
ncbi:MAG: hypothetical protein HZY79_12955 [Rhodoblastus sp.]|nr:MAG: hypothetical protein HZY79_12955 [Rhodoblastus sp.]